MQNISHCFSLLRNKYLTASFISFNYTLPSSNWKWDPSFKFLLQCSKLWFFFSLSFFPESCYRSFAGKDPVLLWNSIVICNIGIFRLQLNDPTLNQIVQLAPSIISEIWSVWAFAGAKWVVSEGGVEWVHIHQILCAQRSFFLVKCAFHSFPLLHSSICRQLQQDFICGKKRESIVR